MSQSNVELFLRGMRAVNSGDIDTVLQLAADDVVSNTLRSGIEGEYRGHDGIRQFFADNAESFEVFITDYHDVRDLGDRVLAIGTIHLRGRGSGVETDIPTAGVATFRDGKLTRWEDYGDRRLALAAVGLRE